MNELQSSSPSPKNNTATRTMATVRLMDRNRARGWRGSVCRVDGFIDLAQSKTRQQKATEKTENEIRFLAYFSVSSVASCSYFRSQTMPRKFSMGLFRGHRNSCRNR